MTRVLVVVTSRDRYDDGDPTGLWLAELTHVMDVMEPAGIEIEIASPKGGATPLDPRSLTWIMTTRRDRARRAEPAFARRLATARAVADVDAAGFDAIYFTGGHGTMWDFPDDAHLQRLTREIHAAGKPVAAVCHGVAGLLEVRTAEGAPLIAGLEITGYSDVEEVLAGVAKKVPYSLEKRLVERGATYVKAMLPFRSFVRASKGVITGQNPQSSRALGAALLAALRR